MHAVLGPSSVIITADKSNPIQPAGSNVTLTCNVEFSPADVIDVPVTVTVQMIDPAGIPLPTVAPVADRLTRYIRVNTIYSFQRHNSGNYTCKATIRTSLHLHVLFNQSNSVTIQVTTGKNLVQ